MFNALVLSSSDDNLLTPPTETRSDLCEVSSIHYSNTIKHRRDAAHLRRCNTADEATRVRSSTEAKMPKDLCVYQLVHQEGLRPVLHALSRYSGLSRSATETDRHNEAIDFHTIVYKSFT